MPRTPARVTQADIARALRAVAQTGVDMRVRVTPDGSIVIERDPHGAAPHKPVDEAVEIRL